MLGKMIEKNAIVTGVSRGIGLAICRQLVGEKFKVYGTYHTGSNEAKLLKRMFGNTESIKCLSKSP
jgi:NAD(P)-dependent dehydrogenase (short-subunit alcohol dehydrogenase family)